MKHKAVTQRILAWMLALALLVYRHSSGKYSKPDRKCSEYDKKQQ